MDYDSKECTDDWQSIRIGCTFERWISMNVKNAIIREVKNGFITIDTPDYEITVRCRCPFDFKCERGGQHAKGR